MKNNKGFAALEALLIFVLIATLGFTGWYVYNARNNANNTLKNADAANNSTVKYFKPKSTQTTQSSSSTSTVSTTTLDREYKGSLNYGDEKHDISVKYPSGWIVTNDGQQIKVSDGKGSQTFEFGGRGYEDPTFKYDNTDFSVDGVTFVDTIITKSDGTVVDHSIRFKDAANQEPLLAKSQLKNLPVFRQVSYPSGSADKYRETLARIYLSFKVET